MMAATGNCSFPSFEFFGPVAVHIPDFCSQFPLRMTNHALTLVLLALACSLRSSIVLASPDEERYVEREYSRDLYDWLNNAARYAPIQAPSGNPCKYPYFLGNSVATNMRMPKRNSELINSLLSLPKNMNDVGK